MDALKGAGNVLRQGVQDISDLITSADYINFDFADIRTVTENQGSALMGTDRASSENRTVEATKPIISSPLSEVSVGDAKQILLNVTDGPDLTLFEAQDASEIVSKVVGDNVDAIFGTSINVNPGDGVVVTVIVTGIDSKAEGEASKQLPGHHRIVSRPNVDIKLEIEVNQAPQPQDVGTSDIVKAESS